MAFSWKLSQFSLRFAKQGKTTRDHHEECWHVFGNPECNECTIVTNVEKTHCACRHNTQGRYCSECADMFFRELSKSLYDLDVCSPCNCFPPGLRNVDDDSCDRVRCIRVIELCVEPMFSEERCLVQKTKHGMIFCQETNQTRPSGSCSFR